LALAGWIKEFQEASEIAADQGVSKCTMNVPSEWGTCIKNKLESMGFHVQQVLDVQKPRITVSW
jgi:hypothetical protein